MFIGREKQQYMWIDTWAGSERGSHTLVEGGITLRGISSSLLSFQSSCCAWLWALTGIAQGPPCVHVSQPKWILVKRSMGRLALLTMRCHPFFWPPKLFCACTGKFSLTLRMRDMWSFNSYLDRAQLLFMPAVFGVSVHRGQTLGSLAWGPIYFPPHILRTVCSSYGSGLPWGNYFTQALSERGKVQLDDMSPFWFPISHKGRKIYSKSLSESYSPKELNHKVIENSSLIPHHRMNRSLV